MSFFHLPNPLSLFQGNHIHGQDGEQGQGKQFAYVMMPGDTIETLAGKLLLPVSLLLSNNPLLTASTPLTPGLNIALPTQGLDRTISQISQLAISATPDTHVSSTVPFDGISQAVVDVASGRAVSAPASDEGNVGIRSAATGNANVSSLMNPGTASSMPAQPGYVPTQDTAAIVQAVPMQVATAADRSYVPATSLPTTVATGDSKVSAPSVSFTQAASIAIGAAQTQHDGDIPLPPPAIADPRTVPLPASAPTQAPWAPPQAAPSAWSQVAAAPDGNQAKLQILALMAVQMGSQTTPGQAPGFIDPQAVAAYAADMRAGRMVDLGAGRNLQFTLVNDRLGRVDAIGEEESAARAGVRRTGDGLDEIEPDDLTETDESTQGRHDESSRERRKMATIAAMRRRRRPRSTRCRYRQGARQPLREPGCGRYPTGVDLSEFSSRQPRRYLWNSPSGRRDDT